MLKDFNKRFLIVDGSHYLYRAYYGVPESARLPNGLKVNAVYGFMAFLRKAVKATDPTCITVVFDSETGVADKTVREKSYKANRDYTDTEIYKQLPLIKKILEYLSIRWVEPASYEADDYIGSLACRARDTGMFSLIFSNDADFLQLIGSNISGVKIGGKGIEVIDAASFKRKYGFANDLYLDYLSLKGDASDNIKGIPGVGPKTAQNLIMNYGSLNNIYSNINCLQKRQKRLIENNRQVAESNMKFLRIITTISSTEFDLENTENISLVELNKPTNYLLAQVGIDTK